MRMLGLTDSPITGTKGKIAKKVVSDRHNLIAHGNNITLNIGDVDIRRCSLFFEFCLQLGNFSLCLLLSSLQLGLHLCLELSDGPSRTETFGTHLLLVCIQCLRKSLL